MPFTMRLLLLRHAKAEKGEPGARDRDRALSARGRADAPKVGSYMARHALQPARALVSPALRTRETWELVASGLPKPCEASFEEKLYHAGPETILDVIRAAGSAATTLLVVGHNPGLHDAARLLIASGEVEARERLNEGLPTSGLVVVDFAGNDWRRLHPRGGRLERFVTPRSLKAAAD
jgi:phosphohistidine phosphatase